MRFPTPSFVPVQLFDDSNLRTSFETENIVEERIGFITFATSSRKNLTDAVEPRVQLGATAQVFLDLPRDLLVGFTDPIDYPSTTNLGPDNNKEYRQDPEGRQQTATRPMRL